MTGFPSAPPTHPDSVLPPDRPSWPTVVGVIAIILGAGGLLLGLFGLVWQVLLVSGVLGDTWMGQDVTYARNIAAPTIVLGVLGVALAVLLLTGAIALLRRRRAAATMLGVWAVVRLLHTAAVAVLGYYAQQEMLATMPPPPPGAPPADVMRTMMMLGLLVGVAWAAWFPLFVLIWFRLPKVRRDLAEHFNLPRGAMGA